MQDQMFVLPQPLSLNPLKDTGKVDEVDYSADFDNLYLINFSEMGKYLITC